MFVRAVCTFCTSFLVVKTVFEYINLHLLLCLAKIVLVILFTLFNSSLIKKKVTFLVKLLSFEKIDRSFSVNLLSMFSIISFFQLTLKVFLETVTFFPLRSIKKSFQSSLLGLIPLDLIISCLLLL